MRTLPVIATMVLTAAGALPAQNQPNIIDGEVSGCSSGPCVGARIRLVINSQSTQSGLGGRFRLSITTLPDTLITIMIGMRPDTTIVRSGGKLLIRMNEAPSRLADLVVTGVRERPLAKGQGGSWSVAAEAARVLPVAVEPDINRALALIPAISFSSILSARPMIRGLDGDDAGIAIDGFEVLNLYHTGRFFSAFPPLAAERVDVDLQPISSSIGHSTSGRVNVLGRHSGSLDETTLQYGIGAWSAATGWSGPISGWVSGRSIRGALGSLAGGNGKTFGLHDLYLGLTTDPSWPVPIQMTVFNTGDLVQEAVRPGNSEREKLSWGSSLLGIRTQPVNDGRWQLDLAGAVMRHHERSSAINIHGSSGDVDNSLSTRELTADLRWTPPGSSVVGRLGLEYRGRDARNILSMTAGEFPSVNRTINSPERGTYVEAAVPAAGMTWTAGVRVDASNGISAVQPRLSVRQNRSDGSWRSLAVGRSSRLTQIISDVATEPRFYYYDNWIPADGNRAPVARVDHAALEIGGPWHGMMLRGGLFAARGGGFLDFPAEGNRIDPDFPYRIGRVRTAGGDIDLRWQRGGTATVFASYAFTVSQRNWGQGWTNWINERRHILRLTAVASPPLGTLFSGTVEAGTGYHYTPYAGISPATDGGWPYHPVTGIENGSTGPLAVRVDAALVRPFHGPFGTRIELGVSITNLTFGEVTPREATFTQMWPPAPGVVSTVRSTPLPMVPSVLFRIQAGGGNR